MAQGGEKSAITNKHLYKDIPYIEIGVFRGAESLFEVEYLIRAL